MGGSAFTSGPDPLSIPRMPPAVYQRVKNDCHAALRELFVYVATPIEAPGKKDHGDIDILVATERRLIFPSASSSSGSPAHEPRSDQDLITAIRSALGAERVIGTTSANLAIPWPLDDGTQEQEAHGVDSVDHGTDQLWTSSRAKHYIQVDVHVCKDLDELSWLLFKNAHGDFWSMVGTIIKPCGLTLDNGALWLRIPEIEKFDRKRSKVMLTYDPVEILHFLGMKVEGFWAEPFDSVDALFAYVSSCRLFRVRPVDEPVGGGGGGGGGEGHEDFLHGTYGLVGGDGELPNLKSNARRRMNTRTVYRRWLEEYISQLRRQGRFLTEREGDRPWTNQQMRDMVREDAFACFHVQQEYRRRVREWRLGKGIEAVKALIKELIPLDMDPQKRASVVRATRKVVLELNSDLGVFVPTEGEGSLKDADGYFDMVATRAFVANNWQEIGRVAWALQKEQDREFLKARALSC